MSNNTVTVALGYTLNTGNFQNIRIDVGATHEEAPGQTTDDALNALYAVIEEQLVDKVTQAKKALVG